MVQGMWLSGRAFALHVKGPGFDPRHLHIFCYNHKALDLQVKCLYVMQGIWYRGCGRAFALHMKGPGFDPRHLHLFCYFLPEVK